MTDNHKFVDYTSIGKLNVNELFETGQTTLDSSDKKTIHRFLEVGHSPIVNKLIYKEEKVDEWFSLLHQLILQSNFNVNALLKQRAERFGDKPLFQTISANNIASTSYNDIWKLVQSIGSYFQSNLGNLNENCGGPDSPQFPFKFPKFKRKLRGVRPPTVLVQISQI